MESILVRVFFFFSLVEEVEGGLIDNVAFLVIFSSSNSQIQFHKKICFTSLQYICTILCIFMLWFFIIVVAIRKKCLLHWKKEENFDLDGYKITQNDYNVDNINETMHED